MDLGHNARRRLSPQDEYPHPIEAFKKNPQVPCKFASDFRDISPVCGGEESRPEVPSLGPVGRADPAG